MKLFSLRIKPTNVNKIYQTSCYQYTTDFFPYTNELYKKKYIKYPVQSRQAILHDYVFHGDERLPTLQERLKGYFCISNIVSYCFFKLCSFIEFKDPTFDLRKNVGYSKRHTKLEELQKECLKNIATSSNDKELEKKTLELKSKWI